MKKTATFLFVFMLLLPLTACAAQAGLIIDMQSVTAAFPDAEQPVIVYTVVYPKIAGDSLLAQDINAYYDGAVSEMTDLILPMLANDEVYRAEGKHEWKETYEVTANTSDLLSCRMIRTQTQGKENHVAVYSQVFAVSGPYQGQTLTLRGMLGEIGESSDQIAELILQDVYQKIAARIASGENGWSPEFSKELLALDFYPAEHFYMDSRGRAVFYLQPGLFREGSDIVEFSYTVDEISRMLNK